MTYRHSDSVVAESDSSAPEISVIVPACNSARTIERCLRSLAAQATRRRFEVIVIHSGTDDTCARARTALPNCRAIQLSTQTMPAAARNHGVTVARGSTLAFIDSDIYVTPGWIDQVASVAQTGHDLVCGSIENANPESAVSRAEQLLMFNEFLPDAPAKRSWFALSGNMVLSREAYERFGPFDEVRAAEDVVFSRRLVRAGGRILFYPPLKVFHENRTTVRAYARNQFLLGHHTARARRLVPFVDLSYRLFLLLLPIAPIAKLAKIVVRLMRRDRRNLWRIVGELPMLTIGLCAYSGGMIDAAFIRKRSIEGR